MEGGRTRMWGVAAVLLGACLVFSGVARADVYNLQFDGDATGLVLSGLVSNTALTPLTAAWGEAAPSPYSVTELSGNGEPELLFSCDDYTADLALGEQWYATSSGLSDVAGDTSNAPGDPQKFGLTGVWNAGDTDTTTNPDYVVSTLQAYIAAGYIANDIMNQYNDFLGGGGDPTGNTLEADSYAMWQIFDPSAWLGGNGDSSTELDSSEIQMVNTEMGLALNFALNPANDTASDPLFSALTIYTPCGAESDGGCTGSLNASQELIGINGSPDLSTPEGSSLATLGFELLLLAVAGVVLRKRLLRRA